MIWKNALILLKHFDFTQRVKFGTKTHMDNNNALD